jgi:uncharacterized protein YjiS (DUF1127 family)
MTVMPFQGRQTGLLRFSRPSRVRAFVDKALAGVHDRRKRSADRRQLAALDDRTLHDLGLSRSDLPYLDRKAAEHGSWIETLRFPPF